MARLSSTNVIERTTSHVLMQLSLESLGSNDSFFIQTNLKLAYQ